MKTQSQIHLENFLEYAKLLERKNRTPEMQQLIEEELERNRELYLFYSNSDPSPLIAAGITVSKSDDGIIEYRK